MIIVVDTNIIFSSLLSHKTQMAEMLLDKNLHFIAPHFLFTEIFKHKEEILKYSKLNEDELLELLNLFLSNIQIIAPSGASVSSIQKAVYLCEKVDLKDVPFVALSIEYDAEIWTGDNELKSYLMQNNFTKFFNP